MATHVWAVRYVPMDSRGRSGVALFASLAEAVKVQKMAAYESGFCVGGEAHRVAASFGVSVEKMKVHVLRAASKKPAASKKRKARR